MSHQQDESQTTTSYQVTPELSQQPQYGQFEGQTTMEWSGPSVPSGYPAHALPGNVGSMNYPVFTSSGQQFCPSMVSRDGETVEQTETSDTSDLDTSPHLRPTTDLPSDQFTFSPVFPNQQYPFYQPGEQQYFPQPSQGYQPSPQGQHFQQNPPTQFINSNQVYQQNPQELPQPSPDFQYQQPPYRGGAVQGYPQLNHNVFPGGVDPHCQSLRPHLQTEGWHQPAKPSLTQQDFSGSQNPSFRPDMVARGGPVMFQQARPGQMFSNGGQQAGTYQEGLSLTESYQDSYNTCDDKAKHLVQNVNLSALPGNISTDMNQHLAVDENALNTHNNSENVNEGNFQNKEVFNQIVNNQGCDDQTRNSSQIQQLSNQMAVVPVPMSTHYDQIKANPRFAGENNNFKEDAVLDKRPMEAPDQVFQNSNSQQQMTIVPGIPAPPHVPQMSFVSNTGGQPLMVPISGNSGGQAPGPPLMMRHPLNNESRHPPPQNHQRFVRPPNVPQTGLMPRAPGMVQVQCPPPPPPHPPPPPPPQVNYNTSLSKDQNSNPQNPMVPLGISNPLLPQAPMAIPGNLQKPSEKVSVPWGWKRVFMGEQVVYFSPSGIQLKSVEEVKEYLVTEGTCKCGLNCPLRVEADFDFDHTKVSDLSLANSLPVRSNGCKHLTDTLALAQIQSTTGFSVRHHHNPLLSKLKDTSKKKVTKKKKPFSGVKVSQMLAAREAEKERINQIIAQQKAEHEASLQLQQSSMQKPDKSKAQNIRKSNSMQKPNEAEMLAESLKHPDTPEKQSSPHLAQRMVHPALLQGSKIMNLGSAAQRFGSENIVISPQSSRRPSLESTENQRVFSLAEAMQAARRLNMEHSNQDSDSYTLHQNLHSKEDTEEDNDIARNTNNNDDNMAVNSSERVFTPEPDVLPSANPTEDFTETDRNEPVGVNSDNAKNIEIRRLSNTEEGNKVLEPSFHSPEKDAKKNPLQNIFNIVSGMEIPTSSDEVGDGRMHSSSGTSSPVIMGSPTPGLGIIRAQLKGKKTKQYSALPPLPHSPPPWVRGIRPAVPAEQFQAQTLPLGVAGTQIMVAPQQLQPVQPVQPMYQMVQTLNGTMLVPINQPIAVENQNFLQIQPAPAVAPAPQQIFHQTSPASSSSGSSGSSSKSSSPGSSSNESPTSKKKTKKRKLASAASSTGSVPILVSPSSNVIQTFQPSPVSPSGNVIQTFQPSPVNSGQIVFNPSHPGGNIITPSISPQVLVNPGNQQMILTNGTLMAVPQTQGIMYQQLPDGTLIQMAPQVPTMLSQPSQGVMMPQVAPQLILTPQGMMQAVGPLAPVQDISRQIQPGFTSQKKRARESKKTKPKKKMKASSSDTSMEQEASEGVTERDSVEDTDTSFEEPQPSTSRSSIQSNQVDSSGLTATPPYHKEPGEGEQLRSPGVDLDRSYQDLDSCLDTSRHSRQSGPSTPASNLSLMDYDSDLDLDLDEAPRVSKVVSSSSKKKKKKKKRRSDSSGWSGSPSHSKEFRLSELVWGPVNGSPSWPGKIVSQDEDRTKVWVCWFVTRQVTQIDVCKLKTLTEGLEEHHRERKNSRRSKKMNLSLEKAIQEAMSELD